MDADLILASASPRRRELLAQVGVRARVLVADVDESVLPGEDPAAYVRRLALAKAQAVLPQAGGLPVLGADTTVVVDDDILGKPVDADEAAGFLRLLSGRRHKVMTSVTLVHAGRSRDRLVETTVRFRPLTAAEIAAYVAGGDWRGKAGGYGIQGPAAAFAPWIQGSFTAVVGLPLAETAALLASVGIRGRA